MPTSNRVADPHENEIRDALAKIQTLLSNSSPDLTQRELLAVTCSLLIENHPFEKMSATDRAKMLRSFLQHVAALKHLPLSSRRLCQASPDNQAFLDGIASFAATTLYNASWQPLFEDRANMCDLSDFVDGRLFQAIYRNELQLSGPMQTTFEQLVRSLKQLNGMDIADIEPTAA